LQIEQPSGLMTFSTSGGRGLLLKRFAQFLSTVRVFLDGDYGWLAEVSDEVSICFTVKTA